MKLKLLLTGFIYTLIGLLLMVQTNIVLAIASDEDNPITAAITNVINTVTNNDSPQDSPSPSPTPTSTPQPSSDPITSPITEPAPTPEPSGEPITGPIVNPTASPATGAPLSAPVLYEINPGVAGSGDTVTLKSFWNNLSGSLIFVGGIIMPDRGYQYTENNTAVSFVLTVGSVLEAGKNYLVHLVDQFGGQSNSVQLAITAPVVNPTSAPTATPSAAPVIPTPVAPVINTVFPNPATWGTVVTINGSHLNNATKIYLKDSEIIPPAYGTASEDGTSMTFTLWTFLDYQAGQTYKVYVKNGDTISNELNLTIAPSVVDQHPPLTANQVLIDPQVNLDADHPELVVDYSNFNVNVSIPKTVVNPTVNFSSTLSTWENTAYVVFNNNLTLSADTTLGTVKVEIPAANFITGPANWNGVMNAPKILGPAGIKPAASAGNIAMTSSVIEVGLGDTPLTFNKAVRILIPGQTGKLLGYQRGDTFTKITDSCSADTQTAGDNLPAGGDCYIGVGNDLAVWTKHFTKFVTYTEAPASSNSANQSTSTSSNPEAPICGDSKPVSTPKLISAKATGRNEVTLSWEKALDPVSYYLVVYGTKPGQPEYGNPNIGGKDTQSYVVKGLDTDKTYYFKVRAGNGCMPGDFSNELSVAVAGDQISGPAKGFKSGVLSSTKTELTFKPITAAKSNHITNSSSNLFAKVLNFFIRLFRG